MRKSEKKATPRDLAATHLKQSRYWEALAKEQAAGPLPLWEVCKAKARRHAKIAQQYKALAGVKP